MSEKNSKCELDPIEHNKAIFHLGQAMKTKEEILQHHYVHDKGLNNPDYVLNAMQEFSDQENAELRRELEKLKIDASNHAYNCDLAKRERDKAERELSELKAREKDRMKTWKIDN